ncbi:MAG: hypothetical protein DI566_00875 [Microbacterium sp.]|nr:MAG: hypothetical protein DI566_00875 [Microbacterium sp.]
MSERASLPDEPHGPDLGELRAEIDELADQSVEELVSPEPKTAREDEPEPEPTDAIGSTDWDDSQPR